MRRALLLVVVGVYAGVTAAAGLCPREVGRWPFGPSLAVASAGDHVLFGSNSMLIVAEAEADGLVSVVAELELPDTVRDIEVREDIAYIAATAAGLQIVDVSEPLSPRLIGSLEPSDTALRVALAHDVALIADFNGGLQVVDVADPSAPRGIAQLDFDRAVNEVAAIDGYAYVAEGSTVRVVDLAEPSNPVVVGSFLPNTITETIVIEDDLAFIGTSYRGLVIFDVSDPTDPSRLSDYNQFEDEYHAVAVSGDNVYLGHRGVRVLDVADPSLPVPVFELEFENAANWVTALAVDGERLLATSGADGLRVIDIATPQQPRTIGHHDLPGGAAVLAVSGTTAFVASHYDHGDGFRAFDVDHPSAPLMLGATVNLPSSYRIADIAAAGDFVYLASFGLRAIDVSDPTAPREAARLDVNPSGLEFSSPLLLVTVWDEGLHAYDASEPSAPIRIGGASVPGMSEDVAVSEGHAFVVSTDSPANDDGGLYVFDLSNPATPTLVGQLTFLYGAVAIAIDGDLAYLADTHEALRIVDVSDPSQPVSLSRLVVDSYWPGVTDVAVADGWALVADHAGGFYHRQLLHVIDVSIPESPRQVARQRVDTRSVVAANGVIYLADLGGGFRIVDPSRCAWELAHSGSGEPLID